MPKYKFEVMGSHGGYIWRNPEPGCTLREHIHSLANALAHVPIGNQKFGHEMVEALNEQDRLLRLENAGKRLMTAWNTLRRANDSTMSGATFEQVVRRMADYERVSQASA